MKQEIATEEEMYNFAKSVLLNLESRNIIFLYGDLGSGKTTFTKGLAKYLGVTDTVTSPTFVLCKEYNIENSKFSKLVHLDLYRLEKEQDALDIGILEYVDNRNNLVVVEWPEILDKSFFDSFNNSIFRIYIKHGENNFRCVEYENNN